MSEEATEFDGSQLDFIGLLARMLDHCAQQDDADEEAVALDLEEAMANVDQRRRLLSDTLATLGLLKSTNRGCLVRHFPLTFQDFTTAVAQEALHVVRFGLVGVHVTMWQTARPTPQLPICPF